MARLAEAFGEAGDLQNYLENHDKSGDAGSPSCEVVSNQRL